MATRLKRSAPERSSFAALSAFCFCTFALRGQAGSREARNHPGRVTLFLGFRMKLATPLPGQFQGVSQVRTVPITPLAFDTKRTPPSKLQRENGQYARLWHATDLSEEILRRIRVRKDHARGAGTHERSATVKRQIRILNTVTT